MSTAPTNLTDAIANELCAKIAMRVLNDFRDFGFDVHAIEITAWRNTREQLAYRIALSREGERKTQPTPEVKA